MQVPNLRLPCRRSKESVGECQHNRSRPSLGQIARNSGRLRRQASPRWRSWDVPWWLKSAAVDKGRSTSGVRVCRAPGTRIDSSRRRRAVPRREPVSRAIVPTFPQRSGPASESSAGPAQWRGRATTFADFAQRRIRLPVAIVRSGCLGALCAQRRTCWNFAEHVGITPCRRSTKIK